MLAAVLCASALLSGCSKTTETDKTIVLDESLEQKNGDASEQNDGNDTGSQDTVSKGRYIEKELTLPASYSASGMGAFQIKELSDGSLAVVDEKLQLFKSTDGGSTWEQQPDNGLASFATEHYVTGAALGEDGSLAVSYCSNPEEEGEDSIGLKVADTLSYHYLYLPKDGELRELDLREAKLDSYLFQLFGFAPDGSVLGASPKGIIYAISPSDQTAVKLFEAAGSVGYGSVQDGRLYLSTSDGMCIYDFNTKQLQEADEALDKYLSQHVSGIGGTADSYQLLQAADGDLLYLAYAEGVYRYDMAAEEKECEQIIDGTLTSFGNPSVYLRDFTRLKDGSFAVAFYGGALSLLSFDADAASRPEEEVTIYSLYENDMIRQAAAVFMKENPDLYVKVQTGLTSSDLESGKTAEDAIKNLNTKILAGEGPDLLIMDDLPYVSYEEKGVLKDTAQLLKDSSTDILPNILQAFTRENGAVTMLPLRFELPLVFGDKEAVAGVKDLTSLADTLEKLRAGRESDKVITNYVLLEKEMLDILSLPSASAWEQDGRLEEAALKEFLTQAKRIYEAQIAGLSQEELDVYRENKEEDETAPGQKNYMNDVSSGGWPGLVQHPDSLSLGTVGSFGYGFSEMTSTMEGTEGLDYALWNGQEQNSFVPRLCVSISAQAPHPAAAEQLYLYLFGQKAQSEEGESGFPVSEKALTDAIEVEKQKGRDNRQPEDDERGNLGYLGVSYQDGPEYELKIVPASDEEFARIQKLLYSVNTPCMADRNLKAIVLEAGEKVLSGEKSVEEGLAEIKKQAAIYLAE